MAKHALVDKNIQDGRILTDLLTAEGLPVAVSAWMRLQEESIYKLYISTPNVEKHGPKSVYKFIFEAIKFSSVSVEADDMVAANTTNHFANAINSMVLTRGGLITINACVFNNVAIDHALIYISDKSTKATAQPLRFKPPQMELA